MLTFEAKCVILSDFYMDSEQLNDWVDEFKEIHDVGLPCAYLFVDGRAIITDTGMDSVEQTWQALCDAFGIDSYGDYESLEEMIELSEREE